MFIIGSCDFETDLCGWKNYPGDADGIDWLWSSGATPGRFTGPSQDHTTGTAVGKTRTLFIYVENAI